MFTLDQVVPWGRSYEEYRQMFALTDGDLGLRVLGCADGPASFNAEATSRGHLVVSADPLYRFSVNDISASPQPMTEFLRRRGATLIISYGARFVRLKS
jgi:hypothetical protein